MSIQICVICPVSHLNEFASLGELDMSLTHLVLKDKQYAKYYKKQVERGRHVILDCSAFEMQKQGKGMDPGPVLKAASMTNPTEVIATDVLYDAAATIESTKDFIKLMKKNKVLGKYKLMVAIQGRTVDEWMSCFETILQMKEVDTIGLSKLSVPESFGIWVKGFKYKGGKLVKQNGYVAQSRVLCTRAIEEYYGKELRESGKAIHLLGGDNQTVWEMNQQKWHPWIRSNDSSVAVWYPTHLSTTTKLDKGVFDKTGRIKELVTILPDLENHNPMTEVLLDDYMIKSMIHQNIIKWHMACKGGGRVEC